MRALVAISSSPKWLRWARPSGVEALLLELDSIRRPYALHPTARTRYSTPKHLQISQRLRRARCHGWRGLRGSREWFSRRLHSIVRLNCRISVRLSALAILSPWSCDTTQAPYEAALDASLRISALYAHTLNWKYSQPGMSSSDAFLRCRKTACPSLMARTSLPQSRNWWPWIGAVAPRGMLPDLVNRRWSRWNSGVDEDVSGGFKGDFDGWGSQGFRGWGGEADSLMDGETDLMEGLNMIWDNLQP